MLVDSISRQRDEVRVATLKVTSSSEREWIILSTRRVESRLVDASAHKLASRQHNPKAD